MGRIFTGALLFAWSIIIIPANLGIAGYEMDLCFGFFVLGLGIYLVGRGIEGIKQQAQSASSSSTSPGQPASITDKIVLPIMLGVASGIITALLQRLLGL